MSRPIVVIVCMDAPPNRGSLNSAHIFGTHVPVEETATASAPHSCAGGGAVHSIMTGLMRCSKTASSFDQVVHGTGTGHSRNGTLWNFGALDVRLAHSGLMWAERITLPHFSVSSPINLRKSVGEPASGGAPKSASRPLILGCADEAVIFFFS